MGVGTNGGAGWGAARRGRRERCTPPPPRAFTFLLTQTRRPHQIPPKLLTSEVQPLRFTGWEWGSRGVPNS